MHLLTLPTGICGLLVQVVWPKLTSPKQSQALYEGVQQQQKHVEKRFEEGCAVLPLMEAQLVHVACNDPGDTVVPHLLLPLLRVQLEAKAARAKKVCKH